MLDIHGGIMPLTSPFKTVEGRAEYHEAYDATLRQLWPVPYDESEVPSRFGTTHVIVSGPMDAPPLVLLHGFMTTSLAWAPYIEAFTASHRVYAIDTLGQPSKSVPAEPIRTSDELVEWLEIILDALGVDRFAMAGISFGGWIALHFAMAEQDRVLKLALLSPAAGFQPLSKQFGLRAILSGVIRTRRMMDSFMRWMGLEDTPDDPFSERLLDLMWIGGNQFVMAPESRRLMPDDFTDEQLRSVRTPTLLLIGEDEVIFDPVKALARARRLVPELDGRLIPECKHDMFITQRRTVGPLVLDFLEDD